MRRPLVDYRSHRPLFTILALGMGGLTSISHAATTTWNTGAGNWSAAGSWDVNGIPTTDGTADVVLTTTDTSNPASTIDSGWGTPADRTVNLVTFTGPKTMELKAAVGVTLNVVTGFVWNSSTNAGQIFAPINFTQTTATINNSSTASFQSNFTTSAASTEIEKTGSGELRFWNGTTGSNISFKLSNGTITLARDYLYGRMGTNLTVLDTNNTSLGFNTSTTNLGAASRDFDAPIAFSGSFASKYFTLISNLVLQSGNTSFRLNVNGAWSGTLSGNSSTGSIWLNTPVNGTASQTWLNADNSGLSSTGSLSSNGKASVYVRGGYYVLNDDNALGTSNHLSVRLGEVNPTGGRSAYLMAVNGHDVSADIGIVANGGNSGTHIPLTHYVGLHDAGAVEFSGAIYLAASNNDYNAAGLALTAPVGGTATFTGIIADSPSGTYKSAVHILGGGTVVLANNNTYANATTVTDNSTLALNGSLTNSNVTVEAGSTLKGTGSIINALLATGHVAPGNSIGTLTVGSANMTGALKIELSSMGSSDKLAVNGNLNIANATLDLIDLGGAFDGSVYVIASYGSLTGTQFFTVSGLLNGYQVDYNYQNSKQIALVVPEPATFLLLTVFGLPVLMRRVR